MDPKKKITIKANDEEKHSSKETMVLPIKIGPIERDTLCPVLDLNLSYTILLGRPWIHDMQAVPSTYHLCVNFPHNGQEITILAYSSQYCNNLKPTQDARVLHNREAVYPTKETQGILWQNFEKKLKLNDEGMGKYSLCNLPLSPKSYENL